MSRPIVVAGAYVVDCIADNPELPQWDKQFRARSIRLAAGGKGLNQAVGAARLGVPAHALGVTGADLGGALIREVLAAEGVDTGALRTSGAGATQICMCFIDGDRTGFVAQMDEAVALTAADIGNAAELISGAGAVIASYENPEPTLVALRAHCAYAGVPLILQPAPIRADIDLEAIGTADILVPNETEARSLLGPDSGADAPQLPRLLHERFGTPTVIVTLGARGCAVHHDGATIHYPAHPVQVVDTLAASDAFAAALGAALANGHSVPSAVAFALRAAAHSVSGPGGYESMLRVRVPLV